uniref:Uncharacterized protein n=1 Tax=Anguilla anguilla TaxID=7936 RepID=A0A0E9X5C6_ANGAN
MDFISAAATGHMTHMRCNSNLLILRVFGWICVCGEHFGWLSQPDQRHDLHELA